MTLCDPADDIAQPSLGLRALSFAVCMMVYMVAARSPPALEPANSSSSAPVGLADLSSE
jgi:hypothetical protein